MNREGSTALTSRPAPATIDVVVPMYDEADNVAPLVARLGPVLDSLGSAWRVLFVDDGSRDASALSVHALHAVDERIALVRLSRNFGKEIALAAGLHYSGADVVVLMDADLQHPPEIIPRLVERWREGFEVVYGRRTDRRADTPLRRLTSTLYYRLFERLSGTRLPAGAGDFRLLDRRAVAALNAMPERARFTKGLYSWIGFAQAGVDFEVSKRVAGTSRFGLGRLVRFGIDGVVSFSTLPLRIWSYVGVALSLAAFAYAVYFVLEAWLFGVRTPGFPTIIVTVAFFSGVQLLSLGIIGEYLARVYEEGKSRPLFVVAETLGVPEGGGCAVCAARRTGERRTGERQAGERQAGERQAGSDRPGSAGAGCAGPKSAGPESAGAASAAGGHRRPPRHRRPRR